ncbi:Cyclin-h [Globisporangium polare]
MAYLQKSTHFNNWVFTGDELRTIHRLRQLKAAHALRLEHQQYSAAKSLNGGSASRPARKPRSFAALVPKSTTAVRDVNDWNDEIFGSLAELEAAELQEVQQQDTTTATKPLTFLTVEQEQVVREFYEVKIQESCSQLFRTSDKVKCCAVMLYKRFYLSNSVMEFHPKFIVPTAIYVAGKIEEQYISVDTIAEQLHVDHKHVIGHEMVLLEGTRFQLIMYHPFRALLGFVDDFRGYAKAKGKELPLDTLQKLHSNSCVVVNDMLLTDLPLTYYPPFLALAALAHVVEELGNAGNGDASSALTKADVLEYIRRSKFAQADQIDGIVKHMEEIRGAYQSFKDAQVAKEKDAEALAKQLKSLYKTLKSFHEEEKSSKDSKDGKEKKSKKDDKKRKSGDSKKDEKKKAKKEKK